MRGVTGEGLAFDRVGECSFCVEGVTMRDFIETKPFGASCVGLATFGIGYLAGVDTLSLIALSLLGTLTYYLLFREGRLGSL